MRTKLDMERRNLVEEMLDDKEEVGSEVEFIERKVISLVLRVLGILKIYIIKARKHMISPTQ